VTGQPEAADPGRVWASLRVLVHERYDRRKKVADALGMSFIRIKALRSLASGPLTMRRLAMELQTDAPYTTVVVDDLVRRGYVERTVDTADRRVKIVQITPAGADVASRANALLDEPPEPLRDLPPEDLAALDRIVAALLGEGEPPGK
jgi:DNA-binding MarR family transcriptional regulator